MKEEEKKVWKELENMGWSNEPKDMHLEYFQDIIKATKKALDTSCVSDTKRFCENDLINAYHSGELMSYNTIRKSMEKPTLESSRKKLKEWLEFYID